MNKANLKSYAPKARLDFIKAVTERANVLGISAAGVVPAEVRGDVALIDGREWPAKVAGQRDELIARIKRHGFEQTMDEVAYTWFNRFAALRYMEIHDYLGHGWRVLSSRDGGLPEILRHANEVTLPGLNAGRAREMQLAGNQDNELYKLLLVAQCNELSRVMPFLFERIDDETELLLPENLLRTDSIVAKLVVQVPEEDWQEIEVIGWLYQFYISEKKDQVIGKVVKSEDIPAATQLFTPNWIVQYLVQNSVGRLWLMANPASTLARQWPYFIQPAEQTPEVQAQLDALIQTRIREDGEALNPETITVLDPACGSGHILVVAYDVLKAIYLERGYQPRAIPRLILEKNLYGLDIDDRAAQLAAFALLMKARYDDRRILIDPPTLNVLSFRDSRDLDVNEIVANLSQFGVQPSQVGPLVEVFEHAKTFGSLIQIPRQLSGSLAGMSEGLKQALSSGDLYAQQSARDLLPLVWQALLLGTKFDAVVANPPYMGGKYLTQRLKDYLAERYSGFEKDLFSAFMVACLNLSKASGKVGFMSPFVWMFIGSHERLREHFLSQSTLSSLIQLEYNASGDVRVPLCAFTLDRTNTSDFSSSFIRLSDFPGQDVQEIKTLEAIKNRNCGWFFTCKPDSLKLIPGNAIAYWLADRVLKTFSLPKLEVGFYSDGLTKTGENAKYLRFWWEVDNAKGRDDDQYRTCHKGGDFCRYFGNMDYLVNWSPASRFHYKSDFVARITPEHLWGVAGITWTKITSALPSFRQMPAGGIAETGGPAIFPKSPDLIIPTLGFLNSIVATELLKATSPTLNLQTADILNLPLYLPGTIISEVVAVTGQLVELSKTDHNLLETAPTFQCNVLVCASVHQETLTSAWLEYTATQNRARSCSRFLQEKNNILFIEAYGVAGVIKPDVPEAQVTLARPDREKDCQRLISYAVGCMMGRYSLAEKGLMYAHAGNAEFDPSRYNKKFPADADGILPLTDDRWFEDDGAIRVREFLRTVWGTESLEENMAWLAASLGTKGNETPDETVRRYLADKFFKDHLQTYKKRPIYWLFCSGKQGAFQALVYMHRYNEGTLARMRAEYVVPLIAKMASRLDMLDKDVAAASSAAARTKLQKQIEALRKKQVELLVYDEKLRHYADMRITLDLDDGVKVNYAKFGDLVAESKAITGGSDDN